jgi:hypothetical protein
MNESTLKVIEGIVGDVLILSQLIMETDVISSNKKINKNTLRDSNLKKDIEIKIESLDNPVIINALFNHYIIFLEWSRPKKYKKKPPIHVLRDWALSRGIPTDNDTLWKISYAIWRDGHQGRPILATLEKEIEESFDKEVYGKLFNSIIEELTKYFN